MGYLDPTIRHSISPPAFDKSKLHRGRLVDAILSNIERKLIAVAAPAGYGKTTLLADVGASTDIPICWLRLSESDKDVMRFVDVLRASLERRFKKLRRKLDPSAFTGADPSSLARIILDLIEAYVDEAFVIAIDDVQYVNSSETVIQFLDSFVEELPDQVTIVASGREVLDVSLARLMAEGDLFGLGPHDLALTRDELSQIADERMGTPLNEIEITRILDESRGWVTGVILSGALSTDGLGEMLTRSRPMVYEYLASVVLNRQPDDLRRFMLDTSVLPWMSADICNKLRERSDSQQLLTRIAKEGAFLTTISDIPRTYEYHPQFRSFLVDSLRGSDERRLTNLRKHAATIFIEKGSPEEAVDLYLESGDIKQASRLAERQANTMFKLGRIETLETWCRRILDQGGEIPKVVRYLATAYVDRGDFDSAEDMIGIALDWKVREGGLASKAAIANLRGLIAVQRGDYPRAIEIAEAVERMLSKRSNSKERATALRVKALAYQRQGRNLPQAVKFAQDAVSILEQFEERYDLAAALLDLASIQAEAGDRIQARVPLERAHEELLNIGAPLPLAVSLNNLAFEAHLDGRYEEALRLYQEALKHSRRAASRIRECNILLGQADLFSDMGLVVQAAELYGEALTIATRIDAERLIRYGCLQTSHLHRRWGRGTLAHDWLRRSIELRSGNELELSERLQLAALQVNASPPKAVMALAELAEVASGEPSIQTIAKYLASKSYFLQGDDHNAILIWQDALDLAGKASTEQVLSAELISDDEFREFVRSRFSGNPIMEVVQSRIETMRGLAQRYRSSEQSDSDLNNLALTALGRMSIERNSVKVTELKPQEREVLHYLVDKGHADRDDLVELFWPEHPPGRQVANLHMVVYGIRRALGKEIIALQGTIYSLSTETRIDYDVTRFERAAALSESLPIGDPRRYFALSEALNAYGGQFLQEFASDWVIERRRRLEMRYLDLLAGHAEEALVRDQPLQALRTLRQALDIDPYRDDINQRYLESLGRLNRRSELVAHYQNYVRLLSIELGLDPPESIRELYVRLLA